MPAKVTFTAATNFAVSGIPNSVIVGDLNGDSKLDLAVVSARTTAGANETSVLLGDGNGNFSNAPNPSGEKLSGFSEGLALADLNGDGKLDLVLSKGATVDAGLALLGNGSGSFGNSISSFIPSLPTFPYIDVVAIGDFNSDSKLDSAITVDSINAISVLLGNGNGSFSGTTTFNVGSTPRAIATGDFNSDGKLDVVTANLGGNNISLLLGNGNGGFADATNFSLPLLGGPNDIAVADINGDGKLDLVTANLGNNTVSVLLGNGKGSFSNATNFAVGNSPLKLKIGDFNGDGKLDLITKNSGTSNNISVLLGDGRGSFGDATNFSTGANSRSIGLGDFNGDNKLDFVETADTKNVTVFLNTTSALTDPNIAPVNTVPAAQTANFNSQLAIAGISVNDVDGNLTTTTLTVTNGTLNLDLSAGATISSGANNSTTLTLRGNQALINSALATLKYQGNPNFSGNDTLTILSTDSATPALASSTAVSIVVQPEEIHKVSIDAAVSKLEGKSDTTPFVFNVNLSVASSQVVTVPYTIKNGTATIADNDFSGSTTGTVVFNSGDPLSKTITVNVNGDNNVESNETFTVELGTPTNATVLTGKTVSTGTILNDEVFNNTTGNLRLIDINPGTGSSDPLLLTNVGDAVYFDANDGTHGIELWKMDATTSSPFLFDVVPGSGDSIPIELTNVNGTLYFTKFGTELWKVGINDTKAVIVGNISDGVNQYVSLFPRFLTNVNDTLYLSDMDNVAILDAGIWKIDSKSNYPTQVVNTLFRTIHRSSFTGLSSYLTNVNGTLYFSVSQTNLLQASASNAVYNNEKIWKIDPSGNLALVANFNLDVGVNEPHDLVLKNVNNTLYFSSLSPTFVQVGQRQSIKGADLWKIDPASGNPVRLTNFNPAIATRVDIDSLLDVNGTTYFTANDGTNGTELWKIDPTTSAPVLFDLNPVSSSQPANLTNVNGILYFTANDGTNGTELWKIDPTTGKPAIVEINPGSNSSNPTNLNNVNGTLYFSADNGTNGTELWKIDPTTGKPVLFDLNPGSGSSTPTGLSNIVGGALYFAANDGTNGNELWTIDQTTNQPSRLTDINPGSGSSNPVILGFDKNRLYFSAENTTTGNELYVWENIPTITSATYNAITGTLNVTGTNFRALAGANNDIDVSKLAIYGAGNPYTLTSTNVEIASETSFQIVLNAADKAALATIINKAGTSSTSGTTYNLAAAEDWAAEAAPGLVVADLTNNSITANLASSSSSISIDSPSITEGNDGTKDLIFTVTGFANNTDATTISLGSSVDYTTVDGTATSGSDYVATSGTLTFAPGEISKTITVKVNGDVNFEPNETFTIKLSNSIGSVIANDTGTGTIINDDVQISGNSNTLRFTKISHLAQYRNELGVFTIDDAQGTVNNIAPSQTGYLAEVLKRSQVIFSALGESAVDLQLDNQASRYIDLPTGQQLGYYLVQNSSTSDLTAGAKPPVFFAFPSNDSGLANAKFTQNGTISQLAFDDTSGGDKDFNDLVVQIENATSPAPLGTAQQGNKNIFDLTSVVNTTTVQTNFEIKRDASYNNHIGFYKIEDAQGSILAGTALIKPGEAGYREAIVQGRIAGIDLVGTNGQTTTSNGSFQGGALYAPFLIANASAANADFSNIYTAYSLGNADKVEHIRLLGDNTFGFEDLFGGGDRDYNDMIIKATFVSVDLQFS